MKKSVKCIRVSTKLIGKGAEYSIKGTGKIFGTVARITNHNKIASNTEKAFDVLGEGIAKGTEITGMGIGYMVDKAFDASKKRKDKKANNNLIVVSQKKLSD